MTILQCKSVSKLYDKSSNYALHDVSLSIQPGRIVGLLGPNGSGKTTLIKLITGLLVPTEGEVLVCDMSPGVSTKSLVSYLPDKTVLPRWMRITQLLAFYADFYADFNPARALEMLAGLDVNPDAVFKALSKGSQEKVQLVLAMSRRAKLYVLDEPIGGVDPAARDFILRTIMSSSNEDSSILIATHLIADIENILDDVVCINNGQVVVNQAADELRESRGQTIDEMFREVFAC